MSCTQEIELSDIASTDQSPVIYLPVRIVLGVLLLNLNLQTKLTHAIQNADFLNATLATR